MFMWAVNKNNNIMNHNNGMKKVMGENHEVNSPKISNNIPRWQWLVSFKVDPKLFHKAATKLKKNIKWNFLLTDWLTN